jgi:hypothetical protein
MNDAAVNNWCTSFYVDIAFTSCGYILRRITESYDNSVFNILRHCQAVFQSICAI